MKNRILPLLLTLALVFVFAVNASASGLAVEMPDLEQPGSLEFTMDVDGVALDSGFLNLYYVADIVRVAEDRYDFRLLTQLADAGATLDTDDLYDSVQAERLLKVSQKTLPQSLRAPIVNGKVSFSDLAAGLYLVWQNEDDASDGYAAIHPFLISVPRWQNGAYAMHVEADPKVPFETEPTEPPPPPNPPPNLPQTGQLNWPIPVMAISGIVLFVVGWVLCRRTKRIENNEE